MNKASRVLFAAAIASSVLSMRATEAVAQEAAQVIPAANVTSVASELWNTAKLGDQRKLDALLRKIASDPALAGEELSKSAAALQTNFAKRETDRQAREIELRAELEKNLAEASPSIRLSKSLRSAIELEMLSVTKGAVAKEPAIAEIVESARTAAIEAENSGDVLNASELFGLLNGLFEESGRYRDDVERLGQRLAMIRLYAPKRLYDLRFDRMKALGEESKMAPYNSLGDDFREKLAGIDQIMLMRAIAYSIRHVERPKINDILIGGLDNMKTMITTSMLREVFPGLGDEDAVNRMNRFLDSERDKLAKAELSYDLPQINALIDAMAKANDESVKLTESALLHEFGNGVMQPLDEYSVVIWPDEVRRFQKNTQGRFVGVGIQIEYDDQSRIKIATPLEGTPAQRAGIHANDILSAVNGKNVYGLTLDQVVDVITGPAGTPVTLTIDRPDPTDAEKPMTAIDFELERSFIDVPSTKGWIRSGEREDAWDYMLDHSSGIGYIRLTQFTESSSDEITAAISKLREQGMKGLIFDLRFNPGGLLDQAVKIARKFIKVEGGIIVQARGASGAIENPEYTRPQQAVLSNFPVIMLINEGSASASEIVSGAVSCYAKTGDVDAILLGTRTFGKGSVQNVWQLTANSHLKLTVQYYMLPDKSIIHRRPGAKSWGVEPHLQVEMLPKQTTDSILLRRDADVIPINENGVIEADLAKRVNPQDLITKGLDLQLETALVLMKARTAESERPRAAR
ncbi:MAG: S41 family peptidase [Phycisphaerales bacterium]